MKISLHELESALGYRFLDRELLRQALTHRSAAFESPADERHYERLELLGDAVVGLATTQWLFRRFPEATEGDLSLLKNRLVSKRHLAVCAEAVGIGNALRLGHGEERSGGRSKRSLLADGLEALLGAMFLEAGYEVAAACLERILEEVGIPESADLGRGEAKNRLQELLQARGDSLPEYRLIGETGPAHAPRFEVEVVALGRVYGRGLGRSKKDAERSAAQEALEALLDSGDEAVAAKIPPP